METYRETIYKNKESQVKYLGQVYFILVFLLSWMFSLSMLKTFKIEQLLGLNFPNKGGTQGLASPACHSRFPAACPNSRDALIYKYNSESKIHELTLGHCQFPMDPE